VNLLFVFSIAGLVLTALFGFETPDDTLLFASSGLLIAAVAAVFVHLAATKVLTRPEKRAWFRELTGPKAPWRWADYLSCRDLRAAAIEFAKPDWNDSL
jgi:hypothetical protein